jgi:hypothetical protein
MGLLVLMNAKRPVARYQDQWSAVHKNRHQLPLLPIIPLVFIFVHCMVKPKKVSETRRPGEFNMEVRGMLGRRVRRRASSPLIRLYSHTSTCSALTYVNSKNISFAVFCSDLGSL